MADDRSEPGTVMTGRIVGYGDNTPLPTAPPEPTTPAHRRDEPTRRRITLDLPAEDAQHLDAVAERSRYNKVTTIGRALQLLDLLDAHAREGGTIVLEGTDGVRERLRIL